MFANFTGGSKTKRALVQRLFVRRPCEQGTTNTLPHALLLISISSYVLTVMLVGTRGGEV